MALSHAGCQHHPPLMTLHGTDVRLNVRGRSSLGCSKGTRSVAACEPLECFRKRGLGLRCDAARVYGLFGRSSV